MSGSGGRGFKRVSPDKMRGWVDRSSNEASIAEHDSRINAALRDLLAQYNDRDVDLVRERLDSIQEALEENLEMTIDLRFGGSIAKRTAIDGLSDVDTIGILRDPQSADLSAREILETFAATLNRELGYEASVSEGQLAVTLTFPDEMQIQILPAIRQADGIRILAEKGDTWSPVIRPEAFSGKLTEQNQSCGGKLVPIIKLAKAAVSDFPDSIKPSGYHIESLAVEAFKGYSGSTSYKAMLQHFFDRSSKLVLNPIRDSTGQSLNVDQSLGSPNSSPRQRLGGAMDRISRRMSNADRGDSSSSWLAAIGE